MSTPAEVYSFIRNQCAESSEEFWTEAEIYGLMTVGERILAQRGGLYETSLAFTTVSGTKSYSLASGSTNPVGTITRMTYDSYRLEAIDMNQIDDVEGKAYGGVSMAGQPEYYYRYGNTVYLSPTPDESKYLQAFYEGVPPEVTTASTQFSIAPEYSVYIQDYALYRMFLKDQEMRAEAQAYKQAWEENVDMIMKERSRRKHRDQTPAVVVYSPVVDE